MGLWTLYELNGYEPESRVLLRIITLRLHANRTFGFKMYLQKATVTSYKRGYIFGTTHTKHNLIMSNWLEWSFEGNIINLFHFAKFLSWINCYWITQIPRILLKTMVHYRVHNNLTCYYSESDEPSAVIFTHKDSWNSFWHHRPFTTRLSKLSLPFRLVRITFSMHLIQSHSHRMDSNIITP